MSIDSQHIALPKLYGAPAYARPSATVSATTRPFDPDQLPLELYREDEPGDEGSHPPAGAHAQASETAEPAGPSGQASADTPPPTSLHPRSFRLRDVAGKFRRDE